MSGKSKPKDLSSSQIKVPSGIMAAHAEPPEAEPKTFRSCCAKAIPCLGCRQPFLRIKRPFVMNGPKFPYENELGYRLGIFADWGFLQI